MTACRPQLELDPADRPARAVAGPQGRRARSSSSPAATPRSRSSAPCCGWPASSGADAEGIPWVNRLVDAVRADCGLEHGSPCRSGTRCVARGRRRPRRGAGPEGGRRVGALPRCRRAATPTRARRAAHHGRGPRHRPHRPQPRASASGWCSGSATRRKPWIYLIVATGDIYEDIPQAQAAAREGADVIAVIRSTGQSLLDYVPEGATREGYAGTYATQENFRLMRAALDDVSQGARPLRPADQLRVAGCACRRSRRWPASSGST